MTTKVLKYPYDPTGVATTNLVQGETITLPRTTNRAFAPNYGLFYADSLVITHVATGDQLLKTDFRCLGEHQEATLKTNKNVTSIIYITNPKYSDGFVYDYQVVGGELYTSVAVIEQMIANLELDGRSVEWDNILDKPTEMPPSPHMHDIADTYGYDHIVAAIMDLTAMVESGDVAMKTQVLDQLSKIYTDVNEVKTIQQQNAVQISQLKDRLTAIGA